MFNFQRSEVSELLNLAELAAVDMNSIFRYLKEKPSDDHLPNPKGLLSNSIPSSAIASANKQVWTCMTERATREENTIVTVLKKEPI